MNLYKIYINLLECISCMCRHLQRPEEGIRSLKDAVTCSCESRNMGAGNDFMSSRKEPSTLIEQSIQSDPVNAI